MSVEAMKMALDALEEIWSLGFRSTGDRHKNAITALRAALAQEPVPPPEAQTRPEKVAYAAGWWAAIAKIKGEKE